MVASIEYIFPTETLDIDVLSKIIETLFSEVAALTTVKLNSRTAKTPMLNKVFFAML